MCSIDTFTGSGALSLALQPFMTPMLYCEWDNFCQSIITSRMRDGRLDKAPIHSDIKTLHISHLSSPDCIVSGFPCQNVSSAGLMAGIVLGEQSSMFFEVMRILDETPSIKFVFLENVANICKIGLEDVLKALKVRNFDVHWTVRSASQHGAPHQRCRWFALATKIRQEGDDSEDKLLLAVDNAQLNERPSLPDWSNEWKPRFTFRPLKEGECPSEINESDKKTKDMAIDQTNETNDTNEINDTDKSDQLSSIQSTEDTSNVFDKNWISRSHALGNAVVPCVVRAAFIELATIYRNAKALCESLASYSTPASSLTYPYPEAGMIKNGIFYPMPKALPIIKPANLDIVVQFGNKTIKMSSYPTPRRGITHPSATITERSLHDLPTVLVHSNVAKEQMRAAGYEPGTRAVIPNVEYTEWIMGFPPGWTKVATPVTTLPDPSTASPPKRFNKEKEITFDVTDIDDTYNELDQDEIDPSKFANELTNASDDHNASKTKIKVRVAKSLKGPRQNMKCLAGAARSGMHLMMREQPGRAVCEAAAAWRELPTDLKAEYTRRAKELQILVQQETDKDKENINKTCTEDNKDDLLFPTTEAEATTNESIYC